MYPKVTSICVQKISLSQFICSSLFRRAEFFTESVAATSSILGIVTCFKGATLDFPITKHQWILPVSSTMCQYEACPYAYSQASVKWCKLQSTILPKLAGLMHLSTDSPSSSFNCFSHFVHCLWILSGIVSSHPKFSLHSCWINSFPWRRKGVANPKWS